MTVRLVIVRVCLTAEYPLSTCMTKMINDFIHLMDKTVLCGRRGGLMISALISGLSGLGSSPGWGHCVVFLGKTLYSHIAPLHPGV